MYDITYHGINDLEIFKKGQTYTLQVIVDYEIENVDQDEMRQCEVEIPMENGEVADWEWTFGYLEYTVDIEKIKKEFKEQFGVKKRDMFQEICEVLRKMKNSLSEESFYLLEVNSEEIFGEKEVIVNIKSKGRESITLSCLFKNKVLEILFVKTSGYNFRINDSSLYEHLTSELTENLQIRMEFLF